MNFKFLAARNLLILFISLSSSRGYSQAVTDSAYQRAQKILSQMTLDEKLQYIGGKDQFNIRDIPRLGIPEIKMADGPQGVRNYGKSTAYPCGIALAATWNKDLAFSYGNAVANDAIGKGIHIMLGPGVNIYRAPMNGRNFEYFGEDPFLTSTTAVGYIKGMQAKGIMATVKHFAANNQEWERNKVSSNVDVRALYEIYFPAFYKAIKEANVGAVMNSYNPVNGIHASQNKWLLTDVLRDDFKFSGILMSDWGSTYNGKAAALAGLDLEMPSGKFMNPDSLKHYINTKEIDIAVIDKKVLHILQTLIRFGFLDKRETKNQYNKEFSNEVALKVAREGIVLLKNDRNILPLQPNQFKNVAVVGNNADRFVTGGGSGWIEPETFTTTYTELKNKLSRYGTNVFTTKTGYFLPDGEVFTDTDLHNKGLKVSYYNNIDLRGNVISSRIYNIINFDWVKRPIDNLPKENFSVIVEGVFVPKTSGAYSFRIAADDGFKVKLDEEELMSKWGKSLQRLPKYAIKNLEKGKTYKIRIEYFQKTGTAALDFGLRKVQDDRLNDTLSKADVIVACLGFDNISESEGRDKTFKLPQDVDEIMKDIIAAGKPVILVMNAGGNVYMQDWIDKVSALVWAWFPGQAGGKAIAEILTGETNPSGKLPATFEKEWKDNPVYNSYYAKNKDELFVDYSEGIFVGYRGYDKNKTEVQYPFGYGLSYTSFDIKNVSIQSESKNEIIVACDIANTGKRKGAETIQLYVGKPADKVPQAIKELKSFIKVELKEGERKRVQLSLPKDELRYYDVDQKKFVFEPGVYTFYVGNSSRNFYYEKQIKLK